MGQNGDGGGKGSDILWFDVDATLYLLINKNNSIVNRQTRPNNFHLEWNLHSSAVQTGRLRVFDGEEVRAVDSEGAEFGPMGGGVGCRGRVFGMGISECDFKFERRKIIREENKKFFLLVVGAVSASRNERVNSSHFIGRETNLTKISRRRRFGPE